MIDLNYYKVFYYVAKLGNFSLAAKKLEVSQPAISYTISELEKTINAQLFIRRGKKIELTKIGTDLFEYVEDCFNTLQLAEKRLSVSYENKQIHMDLGIQSYLINLLPAFKKYISEQNFAEYKLIDDSLDNLVKKVENKEIEFAIIAGHYYGVLNCKKIMDLHMAFVSQKNIKFDNNSIKNYKFALPIKTTKSRKDLDAILLKNNIGINPVYEFNSNHICMSLMNNLDAIFYIPKELVYSTFNDDKFHVIKVDFELPSTPINVIYNDKFISKETRNLINILTNT